MSRRRKPDHVYIARRVIDGAIKIGVSSNVRDRLENLSGRVGPLVLIASWAGTLADERVLHCYLDAHAVGLEFFAPHPEVTRFASLAGHDPAIALAVARAGVPVAFVPFHRRVTNVKMRGPRGSLHPGTLAARLACTRPRKAA